MKKLIAIILVLFFTFGTCGLTRGDDFVDSLTPSQVTALQLDIDIFGMCVSEEAYPLVAKGHSTEYAVKQSFMECSDDGESVITRLDEYGADPELTIAFFKILFGQMVGMIDTLRNEAAEKP